MSVGGKAAAVKVTSGMLELAAAVRPKLIADGMFLVGLDIVADKLMEVNVFSPGGLGTCESLYDGKFTDGVIDALDNESGVVDIVKNGFKTPCQATASVEECHDFDMQ